MAIKDVDLSKPEEIVKLRDALVRVAKKNGTETTPDVASKFISDVECGMKDYMEQLHEFQANYILNCAKNKLSPSVLLAMAPSLAINGFEAQLQLMAKIYTTEGKPLEDDGDLQPILRKQCKRVIEKLPEYFKEAEEHEAKIKKEMEDPEMKEAADEFMRRLGLERGEHYK